MSGLITYIDHLQRRNAEDIAFYPLQALTKAIETKHILTCYENDEMAGYLWYGAVEAGRDVTIYQACVDYSARRRYLGFGMVKDLINIANAASATGIRLKCASSAESNEFWQAIGFSCIAVQPGGIKRKRDLNVYRTELQPGLFTFDAVQPSTRQTDLREYNRMKAKGVVMPSRFSRSHY